MSGIYIKGMEMPKTHPLTVTIYPDGQVLSETVGAKDKHGIAVPVPPHGRLIDADALMRHKGDCYDADGHLLYAVGTGNILRAPTIIEAEEGET